MKVAWCIGVVLLLVSVDMAGAQEVARPPVARERQASERAILFDSGWSTKNAAESMATLQHLLAWTEDAALGIRWFDESTPARKAGGIAARLGKLVLLDAPIDHFTVILAHEFAGHGARYRELGIRDVDYGFDAPPPYGAGGGFASVSIPSGTVTGHEEIAMWTGGLESHQLLNSTLGLRWVADKELSYRDASLFFHSWKIAMTYVGGTSSILAPGEQPNDLNAYVRLINAGREQNDGQPRMSVDGLQSRYRLNAISPLLAVSVYTLAKTYMWDGEVSGTLPMIPLGSVRYLPGVRVGLAPYGLEYHIDNYLRIGRRAALVDVRFGDRSFDGRSGGVGVRTLGLFDNGRVRVDLSADVWKQPGIRLSPRPSELAGEGYGGATSVRASMALGRPDAPVSAVVELGYKSAGYLEGRPLGSSPILAVGIAIRR